MLQQSHIESGGPETFHLSHTLSLSVLLHNSFMDVPHKPAYALTLSRRPNDLY